jgi:cytochrome c oxidase subunit 2
VNPTAHTIAIAYGAVCVLVVAIVVIIWRSTLPVRPRRSDTTDTGRLAHGEKAWFAIAVAALGVLLLATLPFIPYGDNAKAAGQQVVNVTGQQFAWTVAPSSLKAGVPTRFVVKAADVNHGFAVYNADNVMLFQIQAIPDHPSDYVYTFNEPGRYQVVCIEFCGVKHHEMLSTFRVEAAS